MARACACVFPRRGRADECVAEKRPLAPGDECLAKPKSKSQNTAEGGCATQVLQGDAGSINSKELRVNKRDSPRISKEIHIDRKQPLGVSLKGSPKQVLANCGLDEKSRWSAERERLCRKTKKF